MEIRKTESSDGTLLSIEFIHTDEGNFKNSIKDWVKDNLPGTTFGKFFDKLEEFRPGICRINLKEAGG